MELPLSPITQAKLAQSFSPREGETRLGQKVRLLPGAASYMDALTQAKAAAPVLPLSVSRRTLGPGQIWDKAVPTRPLMLCCRRCLICNPTAF